MAIINNTRRKNLAPLVTKLIRQVADMFDDFFTRALVAGVGVALVAGPLGCFIVWRRLAYFGETLSHSALLGVALAFLFEINIALAVLVVSAVISVARSLMSPSTVMARADFASPGPISAATSAPVTAPG